MDRIATDLEPQLPKEMPLKYEPKRVGVVAQAALSVFADGCYPSALDRSTMAK